MKEDHVDYQNMYIKLYTIFKLLFCWLFLDPVIYWLYNPYLDINKHVILIFLRSEQYNNTLI